MRELTIEDYREGARRCLPHFLFEYIDGGAFSEVTLRRNVCDLAAIALRQRVLRDVANLDISTSVLGQSLALPIVLGPIGLAGLAARRGEVQAARAAQAVGVPFCLSTLSLCSLQEVVATLTQPPWFQLYMIRDRAFMSTLLSEAERLKCATLVFTVDMPVPGTRYRDYRSGLAGAPGPRGALRRTLQALRRPAWALDVGLRGRPHCLGNMTPVLGEHSGLDDYFAWMRANFDPTVTWQDLEWVRSRWKGSLVLKGILDVDDAREAVRIGVDALVVSNHGGRQLDGVASTVRALPLIAEAVGERVTVLADGGIRSGLDVVRMLALGAKGVLLGRAWAFALAARGGAGVQHMLEVMASEMKVAMALAGVSQIGKIGRDVVDWDRL